MTEEEEYISLKKRLLSLFVYAIIFLLLGAVLFFSITTWIKWVATGFASLVFSL